MQNSRMHPAIDSVIRATDRTAASVHQEMSRGITSLATISTTAPLVGLAGTVFTMFGPLSRGSGERDAVRRAMLDGLSDSLWPTAFGLCIGIVAYMFHRFLLFQLGVIDHEMASTSARLTVELRRWGHLLRSASRASAPAEMFGVQPLEQADRDEWLRQYERERKLQQRLNRVAAVALSVALILNATSSYFVDILTPLGAVVASLFRIAFHLVVCAAFLYPIWAWPMNRKPGALLVLSSVLAFCWAIIDFLPLVASLAH